MSDEEKKLRKQELRNSGSCCIDPTEVQFLDGSVRTVTAYALQKKESRTSNKVYFIKSPKEGEIPLVDESKLIELIGTEMFEKLKVV